MADLAQTPTSVLDAVNELLRVIGEPPVSSVEDNGVIYAVTALQTLTNVNRTVQLKGWNFNRETEYPITPSYPEREILLPPNALSVGASASMQTRSLIQRGQRLYDKSTRSFQFDRTVYLDITFLLPFDELPEAARNYITIRASRRFQEGAVGSDQLSGFSARDELMALVSLEEHEAETADYNILNNVSVQGVMSR